MVYDVCVIGSGPGGYVAAIRAAQYGLRVAVIEKRGHLGGVCLHVGCIPTKALLHFAELYEYALKGEEIGIIQKSVELDLSRMLERKNEIVARHAKGVEFLLKKHEVDTIRGYGRLLGDRRIEVTNGDNREQISAENIILATGSEAQMLPGLEKDSVRVLTNVEILDLDAAPASLTIVGGGAVGVEFASLYRSFGSEVTVLEMLPRLVSTEDEDVSKELERAFRRKGIQICTGAKVEQVTNNDSDVSLEFVDSKGQNQRVSSEKVLVAVGRKPNTENIGLENTAVETDHGFIVVDEWMKTAEPGVCAIGDIVAGKPQLAHVASMEGLVAVGHLAGKDVEPLDYLKSPAAIYCEPQIGSVGLSEAAARQQGCAVRVGKFGFGGNSKASILGNRGGFVKVVADAESSEILGVHIIGPLATELISEAVVAISMEATVESMMYTVHSHPTLSEAVQEAFNGVRGMMINA